MKKLEVIQNKIFTTTEIVKRIALWRFLNKKVLFTNGCFDILHEGHFSLLAQSASLESNLIVIVGLNSDNSVKRLKGNTRPINTYAQRAFALASLYAVDAVVCFDEDTPLQLIELLQPDILLKGGDYNADTIIGATEVNERGGKVVIIPFVEGYSSSSIIEKIKN